jgi:hypothetical protein
MDGVLIMAEYTKNIVINCNPDGAFASATKQVGGVTVQVDGVEVDEPQPNVSIELAELRTLVGVIRQ